MYDANGKGYLTFNGNTLSIPVLSTSGITSNGYVYVMTLDGTTGRYAIGSWSTDGYRVSDLGVNSNGNLRVSCQTGVAGSSLGSHTLLAGVSDKRLKSNIEDCKINALEVVDKIKVREFDWNGYKNNRHQKIGFIADELEEIDLFMSDGEGGYDENGNINIKSVDSFYLQGYEIKSIQELHQLINTQQQQIDLLQSTLNVVLKEIQQLKQQN